jgi:hypothetical protein
MVVDVLLCDFQSAATMRGHKKRKQSLLRSQVPKRRLAHAMQDPKGKHW